MWLLAVCFTTSGDAGANQGPGRSNQSNDAGCFLSGSSWQSLGVWASTSSSEKGKKKLRDGQWPAQDHTAGLGLDSGITTSKSGTFKAQPAQKF